MKKLLSIHYSPLAFNAAMLVLRIAMGALMMAHGYQKLVGFSSMKSDFYNLLGMGSTLSLAFCIFAEFFCALFVMIGLFTRLVTLPLIISTSIALFDVHAMDFFNTGEKASLFLSGYIVLLLLGPGRASVDGIAGK
jgi:putative oxidoreductase